MNKPATTVDHERLIAAVDEILKKGGAVSRVRGYTQTELNAACEMLFRLGFCDVYGFGESLDIPPPGSGANGS